MSIWYHTNDQPPYPEKEKLRYGSHAYESPSRSAQSDSFQVCTEEYGIERYYPAAPTRRTCAMLHRRSKEG